MTSPLLPSTPTRPLLSTFLRLLAMIQKPLPLMQYGPLFLNVPSRIAEGGQVNCDFDARVPPIPSRDWPMPRGTRLCRSAIR